jgi:hypothetical protein
VEIFTDVKRVPVYPRIHTCLINSGENPPFGRLQFVHLHAKPLTQAIPFSLECEIDPSGATIRIQTGAISGREVAYQSAYAKEFKQDKSCRFWALICNKTTVCVGICGVF